MLGYVWVTHWMQVVTRTETLPVGWVLLAVSTEGLAMQYLKLSLLICGTVLQVEKMSLIEEHQCSINEKINSSTVSSSDTYCN